MTSEINLDLQQEMKSALNTKYVDRYSRLLLNMNRRNIYDNKNLQEGKEETH